VATDVRVQNELLEREAELARLEAVVDAAASRSGEAVFVEGVAGIGKSRLVAAARAAADSRGLRVLFARGAELETDFPFGVALQLFEPTVRHAADADRNELFDGAAALARPLFAKAPAAAPAAADPAFGLIHGLYWLCQNLAERAPVVLFVDDLHWADRASLRFLLYLAQRLDELPIAVVAAVRSGEGDGIDELDRLRAHPAVARVLPSALSAGAVGRLVEQALPGAGPAFCAVCSRLTRGNPFLLRELTAQILDERIEPTDDGAARLAGVAPTSIVRAMVVRLARLHPDAGMLLRAGAVLGDETPSHRAATLAGLSQSRTAAAADALAAADLLAARDPLAFTHPIVRAAMYDDIPLHQRQALHLTAARILSDDSAPAESVAAHLLNAGDCGGHRDWAVASLGDAAARARGRGAPGSALGFLRRALALCADTAERAALLLETAETEAAIGDPAAAEHAREAADGLDDPRAKARAWLAVGRAEHGRGRYGEAAESFRAGLEAIGDRTCEATAALRAGLASASSMGLAGTPEALSLLGGVVERARASRPAPAERPLLAHIALARAFAGGRADEIRMLAELAYGDGALIREQTSDAEAVYLVTAVLHFADAIDRDLDVLDVALADARRRGSIMAYATASFCRSVPALHAGRLAEATADAEAALDGRRYGWEMYWAAACGVAALCHTERDDRDAAYRMLGLVDLQRQEPSQSLAVYLLHRGAVRQAWGDSAGARDDTLAAGGPLAAAGFDLPAFVPWRSQAALAAHHLGHADQAAELAVAELEMARAFGAPRSLGMALRVSGLVTGGDGGVDLLREAVRVLEGSESVLERARALVDLGAALRRANHRAEAREPLRSGWQLAVEMGAARLAAIATEELTATGERAPARRDRDRDALTAGEMRVARLAADGMTNKQIAQALFVTVKAVEWHLGHAYPKLGIRSRRELSGVLASFQT
jgi:DNA-binding CsgD family transcriptional regulator